MGQDHVFAPTEILNSIELDIEQAGRQRNDNETSGKNKPSKTDRQKISRPRRGITFTHFQSQ